MLLPCVLLHGTGAWSEISRETMPPVNPFLHLALGNVRVRESLVSATLTNPLLTGRGSSCSRNVGPKFTLRPCGTLP